MEDNRNQSIDLIKIIAMVGVIALNSTKSYIDTNNFSLADIVYDLGIVSIPLFFMVSGYLLIPRKNITYFYVIRKIIGILRFVFLITFSFSFLYSIKHGFKLSCFLLNFFGAFFQYGAFSIFWYFGALILCYILLPLVSKIFHSNLNIYSLILLVLFLACNSVFSHTLSIGMGGGNYVEFLVPATLRLWYIYFYFLLGGLLYRFSHIHINWIIILFLFIGTIAYKEYFDNIIGSEFASLFYSAPIVMALCAGIFISIKDLNVKENRIVSLFSETFLPVYTIHIFVIDAVNKLLNPYDCWFMPLICWSLVSIMSVALSYLIMKIPFMKTIFKL